MSDLPNTKERNLRESGLTMKKTVDDDRILRIEEEDGSAITIYKERGYGHILSILVAQDERGQGIGSELLSVAEQELFDCGIQWILLDAIFTLPLIHCNVPPFLRSL